MSTTTSFDATQNRPGVIAGQPWSFLWLGPSSVLLRRVFLLALLFVAELIPLTIWLDGSTLPRNSVLLTFMAHWGAWTLRSIVCFAALFMTFAWLKNRRAIETISREIAYRLVNWRLLTAHFVAMGGLLVFSFFLYGGPARAVHPNLLAVAWLALGLTAIALAAFAFVPLSGWIHLAGSTGFLSLYAALAAVALPFTGRMTWRLWEPASRLTFVLSKFFLSPFVTQIVADPVGKILGTPRFKVEIAPQCSGLEGVALILAFGILWLLIFRKECRFPQCLALLPLGVLLLFVLNSARIAALILIGSAGARHIAEGGFHSQAGWITFSVVAMGFCGVVQRVPWFTVVQRRPHSLVRSSENPTAAFLLPFMAILAAGMIATATSGGFEWLYPLRFVAAAVALWIFRKSYSRLNWRFGWLAILAGVAVFLVWIGLDRVFHHASDPGIPVALATAPASARIFWMVIRILAAVVTVPIAEELAFRGYLMRRLVSADFEYVSFGRFTWFALIGSSVIFGFLHGGHWLAGIIAGILFGLVAIRSNKFGDAAVAHATANALLAAYVLFYHQWHLW